MGLPLVKLFLIYWRVLGGVWVIPPPRDLRVPPWPLAPREEEEEALSNAVAQPKCLHDARMGCGRWGVGDRVWEMGCGCSTSPHG